MYIDFRISIKLVSDGSGTVLGKPRLILGARFDEGRKGQQGFYKYINSKRKGTEKAEVLNAVFATLS